MVNEWMLLGSRRRPRLLLNERGLNLDGGFDELKVMK